ncbi:PREDICTED: protein LNK2 isoform X2 [Camelina sativa]|uniref:Protein LNK2 isoform X2 n=2 Tax=Camelina sativa TaxID=90675 RepID=A0ABM0ZHX6_CAMSA|nr:PREDICTED: protein LNK2 isoform X2 [Camelina sativa]
MFDWEEEELTNMIWGDNGETGDHIVPFKVKSEQLNKKDTSEESKTAKSAEQKISVTTVDLADDDKLGSSSGHNVDDGIPQPGFCMPSWPVDSSLSNARKDDPDSSATELSKCLAEPAIYDSSREKPSELAKGPDIFHSTDESKEQGDFDEYGWANIGSFDDLDRMFSNDVPIFGDGSLSGADELWSSSKDVSNSPKSLSSILDPQDLGLDIRTEFEKQENQQFLVTGKANGLSSQSMSSVHATLKAEQYRENKGQHSVQDQPYQQNKMMKFTNMSGSSEEGAFQDLYSQRTPSRNSRRKFVNQLAPPRSSLMAVNLQRESQGSGTSHYSHMPNQYMTTAFGNLTSPYSSVPVLSAVQHPDLKNQLMHPSYDPATATSVNMAPDISARPSTMTPQEKLEKLRRRQQMQAMLAIQRQQQQFSQQVPVVDQSITQNSLQDIPLQFVDKTNLQGITTMPSFDPNSSLEQDDSGNFTAAIDNSAEFSVLYRLQDVVAKLNMGTRTCIRDSLFRLAGSAAQRHYTNDTAHSNKTSQDDQEVIPREKSRYRYAGMPDTEAVTNPTDRTVAHLLFHRPFDMPAAKHMEGPESPASSKMGSEEKGIFPKCSIRESRLNKQKAQEEGPTDSLALGNAPNSGSSCTVGERDVEESQGNKRKL